MLRFAAYLTKFLVLPISLVSAEPETRPDDSAAKQVQVVSDGGGQWHLLVEGQDYEIKGAGAYEKLPELKAAGANSVRTWQSREHDWFSTAAFMDEAADLGLTVMAGLELPIGQEFDYGDAAAVDRLIEQQRTVVRNLASHPALILWGIGNEIEWRLSPSKALPVWKALNRIARMVKEEDPNHPTVIVLAGDDRWKIEAVKEHCPDIDILGLNVYQTLPRLPAKLERTGWTGPYLITEFGYRGWWAQRKTDWGTITEQTSSRKAAAYRSGFEKGIRDQPACIGSYAFIWGSKEEATFTYFGTHLPSGEPTAIVDTLAQLWTGSPATNPAPQIQQLESDLAESESAPGTAATISATVTGSQPIEFEWTLATDRSDKTVSGDVSMNRPAEILQRWTTRESRTDLTLPNDPDTYRLYFTARDPNGKAASANFPFRILPRKD